ncbi:MAG: transporter [Verrucomicrobiia bacterium]
MRHARARFAALVLASCWLAGAARASDDASDKTLPDKSGYNLLNPTPDEAMRELSPDRPDKTESPYTLDAGHFMVEMDFATFTHDDTAGVRTETWNVAPANLKVGLLNNVDLQFIYDNYVHVRTEDRLGTMTQSGFGDLTPRLKINLWGNDGGKTAFALLPFVKFPVNTDRLGNDAVEGGMILPLSVKLPADWDMGLEAAASCFRNATGSGYHAEFIQSITFDHAIVGKLSGYCEFFSDLSTEGGPGWVGTVDVGLEYLVTENVQLDCGCNVGVTTAADDVNAFTGITVRF